MNHPGDEDADAILQMGTTILTMHTEVHSTKGLSVVEVGYIYLALACPFEPLAGTSSKQKVTGLLTAEAVFLCYKFKFSKGAFRLYQGMAKTVMAKSIDEVELCTIPWSAKLVQYALFTADEANIFLGKDFCESAGKLMQQCELFDTYKPLNMFGPRNGSLIVQLAGFEAMVEGKLNLTILQAILAAGFKVISFDLARGFGKAAKTKGISISVKSDLQLKWVKKVNEYINKFVRATYPLYKDAQEWLNDKVSDMIAEYSPVHSFVDGSSLQVCTPCFSFQSVCYAPMC